MTRDAATTRDGVSRGIPASATSRASARGAAPCRARCAAGRHDEQRPGCHCQAQESARHAAHRLPSWARDDVQELGQPVSEALEPVLVRGEARAPHEPRSVGREQVGHLDDARLRAPRQRADLAHPAPLRLGGQVDHQVHAPRHGRHDEARVDVRPGQQRKRAELGDGLARTVGMQRRHRRHPAVHRHEEVEGLRLAHLADHQPRRAHAQRLAHQPPQRHLARPLEARIAGLEGDPVRVIEPDLEHLLAADDALGRGHAAQQRVEEGGLARLRSAGHHDVQPGDHGGLEEVGCLRRQHAEPDEVADRARPHDEPPHVDGPVLARDVGDGHVQPAAVGQHRVDERAAQVEAAPGHAQHALDEGADLRVVHDDRGQLAAAVTCDEDAIRGVDPDLLDGGVVEEPLQRAEPGDRVEHGRAHRRDVVDRTLAQGLLHRLRRPAGGRHPGHAAGRCRAHGPRRAPGPRPTPPCPCEGPYVRDPGRRHGRSAACGRRLACGRSA